MKTRVTISPANLLLSDASTKEILEVIEANLALGDLGPSALWAYLHARQNEAIIERLDTLLELKQPKALTNVVEVDLGKTDVMLLANAVNLTLKDAAARGMRSA